jgi:hypothetical protein
VLGVVTRILRTVALEACFQDRVMVGDIERWSFDKSQGNDAKLENEINERWISGFRLFQITSQGLFCWESCTTTVAFPGDSEDAKSSFIYDSLLRPQNTRKPRETLHGRYGSNMF